LFELSHEEVLRTQRRRAKHAGSAYRAPIVQDRAYRAPDSHDATSLAAILRSDKEFLTIVKNAMSKRLRRGKPARNADPAKGGESDSSSTGGEMVPTRRPEQASAGLSAPPRESAALSGRRLRPAKDVVCPPQQVASPVARQGPGDPPVRQTGALAQVGREQRPFSSDFLPISRHSPGQPLSSAAAVVQPHLHGSAEPLHQASRTPLGHVAPYQYTPQGYGQEEFTGPAAAVQPHLHGSGWAPPSVHVAPYQYTAQGEGPIELTATPVFGTPDPQQSWDYRTMDRTAAVTAYHYQAGTTPRCAHGPAPVELARGPLLSGNRSPPGACYPRGIAPPANSPLSTNATGSQTYFSPREPLPHPLGDMKGKPHLTELQAGCIWPEVQCDWNGSVLAYQATTGHGALQQGVHVMQAITKAVKCHPSCQSAVSSVNLGWAERLESDINDRSGHGVFDLTNELMNRIRLTLEPSYHIQQTATRQKLKNLSTPEGKKKWSTNTLQHITDVETMLVSAKRFGIDIHSPEILSDIMLSLPQRVTATIVGQDELRTYRSPLRQRSCGGCVKYLMKLVLPSLIYLRSQNH
jgi:hypothetical protein